MSWTDFDHDSALEQDILERALPLLPLTGAGGHVFNVDAAQESISVNVALSDALGATPEKCVDLLGIRPLLTGAAWKALDLLIEYALEETGRSPSRGQRWHIDEKTRAARDGISTPPHVSQDAWSALLGTYVATEEYRHSLVHRRVYVDKSHALVGTDRTGNPLRPLAPDEQEALGRAVLRASAAVTASAADSRLARDLVRQLHRLHALHKMQLPPIGPIAAIHQVRFTIDAAPEKPGHYLLDIPRLRQRLATNHVDEADLVVLLRDRPGQELRGRLEDAPSQVVTLDPDRPPTWLT